MYKKLALIGLTGMVAGSVSMPMSASWNWKKSAQVGIWVAVAAVGSYAVSLLIKHYWPKKSDVQQPDATEKPKDDTQRQAMDNEVEALVQECSTEVAQENLNKEIVTTLCKYAENLQKLLAQNKLNDGWKHNFKNKVCKEFNKATAELIKILQSARVKEDKKQLVEFMIAVLK